MSNRINFGDIEVKAWGEPDVLCRPCVDCGMRTGSFCDGWPVRDCCLAALRCPDEVWAEGQKTPYCTRCEARRGREVCHFCRGQLWVRPPAWREGVGEISVKELIVDMPADEEAEGWEKVEQTAEESVKAEEGEREKGEADVVEGHEAGELEDWLKREEERPTSSRRRRSGVRTRTMRSSGLSWP